MDHSKLRGVVAIENGVWFSPFGHEIPSAESLEFVTFGFHHDIVASQNAEIERLQDEVSGLKLQLGMCDSSLISCWRDAIDAAGNKIDELYSRHKELGELQKCDALDIAETEVRALKK